MSIGNRLMVCVCVLGLSLSLVGCGSSTQAASQSSASSATSSASASESAGKNESAAESKNESSKSSASKKEESSASYDGVIKQEYVGKWTGLKLYPVSSPDDAVLLADAGRAVTVNISADGTAEVYISTSEAEQTNTYGMEEAETGAGYALVDEDGKTASAVEYKAGDSINWLYLIMCNEEGEFFITTCYREDEVNVAGNDSEPESAAEPAGASSVDDAASLCKTPGAAKLVEKGRSGDGWEQATPAMQNVAFGRLSAGAGREVWQICNDSGLGATMSQAEFEDIVLALATQLYGDQAQGQKFLDGMISEQNTYIEEKYGSHGPGVFTIDGIDYYAYASFSIAGSSRTGYSLTIFSGESLQQEDLPTIFDQIYTPPFHPLTSADLEELFG